MNPTHITPTQRDYLARLPTLDELDDYKLEDDDQDVRGHDVRTRSGRRVGRIEEMLVDREDERVAALVLDDGHVVPVEEVELRGDDVVIDDAAPIAPPKSGAPPRSAKKGTVREERVPIVDEEVAIGKRVAKGGRIRVRSRVVERPVHEDVRLREERVDVQRRPVNKPVDDPEALLKDRTVEMTEKSEEPVVGKRAKVTEEVVIRKEAGERVEGVDATERHTKVDVDREPRGDGARRTQKPDKR